VMNSGFRRNDGEVVGVSTCVILPAPRMRPGCALPLRCPTPNRRGWRAPGRHRSRLRLTGTISGARHGVFSTPSSALPVTGNGVGHGHLCRTRPRRTLGLSPSGPTPRP
jgi:hypothetical protein